MHRCEDLAAHPDVFVLVAVLSTPGDVEGTARQQVFSVCCEHDLIVIHEQHFRTIYPRAKGRITRHRGLSALASLQLRTICIQLLELVE